MGGGSRQYPKKIEDHITSCPKRILKAMECIVKSGDFPTSVTAPSTDHSTRLQHQFSYKLHSMAIYLFGLLKFLNKPLFWVQPTGYLGGCMVSTQLDAGTHMVENNCHRSSYAFQIWEQNHVAFS